MESVIRKVISISDPMLKLKHYINYTRLFTIQMDL